MSSVIEYSNTAILLEWACKKIGIDRFKSDAVAIGKIDNGVISAVVVYDGFSNNDCCMHIASDGTGKWMNRASLIAAFSYPFIQCGFDRVTGLVPEKNEAAISFDINLGFVIEGMLREGVSKAEGIVVLGMLRRECRFIPKEYRV